MYKEAPMKTPSKTTLKTPSTTPLVSLLTSALALASTQVLAQDIGRVISSTPVVQQVAVPRQVCTDSEVEVQAPRSGAGAMLGAIAGGAAGNALGGRGAGQAAATMLGVIGGAMLGDHMEGEPDSEFRTVRQCSTQHFLENRTVGYNVVYEYAGKQYSVQMPNDPGTTLPLQISPAGASTMQAPAPVAPPPTVYVQPAPVTVLQPYPVYYSRPYYPAINLQFGRGYYWGVHHGRRWR
ncbi:MAG: hypothetical protein ORN28_11035 [Rhodoferax sp.]|nr:hypothetical protein [Rhodoferax sp.]